MSRKIIHIDMDCYFAAIEQRDHPELAGKPIAVGGKPQQRGVISTANYEARKFGVHSALSSSLALKRCPQLILLPHRFSVYKEDSLKIREIFKRYTSLIEPLSLDEAFLDVSHCTQFNGNASQIALDIRKSIKNELKLTASAGIAPNKFLAKIASEWNKPNGQFVIEPKDVPDFIRDLPIEKIFGVGKVTAKKMNELGIKTCFDLQKYSKADLIQMFGKWGVNLYLYSRGLDYREVKVSRIRKSFSVENTYSQDLHNWESIQSEIPKLFDELQTRLQRSSHKKEDFKGIHIKVKFHDFEITTVASSQASFCLKSFLDLFQKGYSRKKKPARLLGLGVTLNSPSSGHQLSFEFSNS
ncbi:MAG: DNA polymerase IV [Halobacteriovoraceae bacterium]|nr:DNA polymerase IV [Halobacteriovoraceae bacterium]MCB9095234.1 DNA polymerase IV [Halobacteriovoraceae bacterium]